MEESGRSRVLIEAPSPSVDGGRHAAKRIVGDTIVASCDLVLDGHDVVAGDLLVRAPGGAEWTRLALAARTNDRFEASFVPDRIGVWEIAFEAWVDPFATWSSGVAKKAAADQDIALELTIGARLLADAATRSGSAALDKAAAVVSDAARPTHDRLLAALTPEIAALVRRHPDLRHASRLERPLAITVDRKLARFSAWYEFFPRSTDPDGRHGTFATAESRLVYAAEMGFDIVYIPPIHPIGAAFRKGPNNREQAGPDDVGSPWAIGSAAGGHKAVHPELGTLEDFRRFVGKARELGLAVALDIAFQVSPDHPYVREHPEWFRTRPDGTIQYAENPPKKYQDVYPFDFEGPAWRSLWEELASVFLFWIEQGVTVFRVDNPHTKSLRFWAWCLAEVKRACPEAIFLAEAFTRPKLMYALAKGGFTQSYTYFTWRIGKEELTRYLTEITRPPVSDFYQPSFWPNTPDILPEHLQDGGRPAFLQRLVLAATLSSSYGVYGPAFELMDHVARPGSEEYVDNEKYELKRWNIGREDSLRDVIMLLNRIRRENPALHHTANVVFHATTNDQLLCFSKRDPAGDNVVVVVVNLDPHHKHAGFVELDTKAIGVADDERFQVHDELADTRHSWVGARTYVELDPAIMPAHLFRVRRKVRHEHDFEYFL